MKRLLRLDAGGRRVGSVSRELADRLVGDLVRAGAAEIAATRDLANDPVPLVDADWIAASGTPEAERGPHERAALAASESLIEELLAVDLLVLTSPIYNFAVPAALKAWIDQVCRARRTFHYTESGPQGLLTHLRAVVVIASGGTASDGPVDFATPYLRHILGFIGITDVTFIVADRLFTTRMTVLAVAERQLREAVDRLTAIEIPAERD